VHHDELHRVGNEKAWWLNHGVDPLKVAAELWAFTLRGERIEDNNSDKVGSEPSPNDTGISEKHLSTK
jgi:hypothetical protein